MPATNGATWMRLASRFAMPLLLTAVFSGSVPPARAEPAEGSNLIATVVARVSPAVVRIIAVKPPEAEDGKTDTKVASAAEQSAADHTTTAIGSGFIIDPAGFIATNKHVVEGGTSVFVMTSDGIRHQAQIVGMPGKADMALLRIYANHPFPSVSFGDSDKARVGDTVIAIGSPFGFDNTVTSGIVSAVDRDIMESPFDDYIQTDAAINHGNSGGPLFDLQGNVIGMNSVIFSPSTGSSGLGFSIPSNDMKFVFDRLMKTGEVRAGMLPIHTQQVTWMLKQALNTPDLQGALVSSVHDQNDMMMHGQIKAGDVILTFNGEKVLDPRDLARKAAWAEIGSDAELGIFRAGTRQTVHVKIHEWPPAKPIVLVDNGQRTIGLDLVAVPGDDGKQKVSVGAIDPSGTAADSGILKGDIIVEIQQTAVTDPDQAMRLFSAQSAERHHFAAVLVERDKKLTWMPLAVPD